MRTIAGDEATRRWLEVVAEAQHQPVKVTRAGGPDVVVLSAAAYERIRGAARQRLKSSLQKMHDEVEASGLDAKAIEALIADET